MGLNPGPQNGPGAIGGRGSRAARVQAEAKAAASGEDGKRKYLPAEAYRFLVLAALAHRRGASATKGQLAWDARANHYMITRVLRELHSQGLVAVEAEKEGAYAIRLTTEGEAFHAQHRDYFVATFRPALEAHFRYGTRPRWAGLEG